MGKLGKLWVTISQIPVMTTILRSTTFYNITKVYTICIIPIPLLGQILGPLILV